MTRAEPDTESTLDSEGTRVLEELMLVSSFEEFLGIDDIDDDDEIED